MKRNDQIWKAALEDLFEDFLYFFFPDADKLFDIGKGFVYLDKELDQLFPPSPDQSAVKYVDKLVKVFTKSGDEQWILIHIEVQSYADKDFAKRMYQYYYRILDQYDRPVTAFAIFADTNKNFHPKYYEREYLGTKVRYDYNTYKIIDQDDAKLEESDNPFALAVLSAKLALTKQLPDDQLYNQAFDLAKRLLRKQMPKEKIRRVLNFLRYSLNFDNQELFIKFEQEISNLTERRVTVGIDEFIIEEHKKEARKEARVEALKEARVEALREARVEVRKEALQEGRQEGRIETTKEVAFKMKQSGLDINLIASITGLSVDVIEQLS